VIAYLTHRNIAFVLACAIGVGAFGGSAAELVRIAENANYAFPLGLVAALDGLSVVCVVVLARRADWQAAVTLAAATLASVALQALAVPHDPDHLDRYVSAVAVHVLVPLASFVAIHHATRLDRGDAPAKKPRPKPAPRPAAPPEVSPTPLRPPRPDAQPVRPAARSMGELIAEAQKVAEARDVAPAELSQRTLMAELKVGSKTAADLAKVLKASHKIADDLRAMPGGVEFARSMRGAVEAAEAAEKAAVGAGSNGARP